MPGGRQREVGWHCHHSGGGGAELLEVGWSGGGGFPRFACWALEPKGAQHLLPACWAWEWCGLWSALGIVLCQGQVLQVSSTSVGSAPGQSCPPPASVCSSSQRPQPQGSSRRHPQGSPCLKRCVLRALPNSKKCLQGSHLRKMSTELSKIRPQGSPHLGRMSPGLSPAPERCPQGSPCLQKYISRTPHLGRTSPRLSQPPKTVPNALLVSTTALNFSPSPKSTPKSFP